MTHKKKLIASLLVLSVALLAAGVFAPFPFIVGADNAGASAYPGAHDGPWTDGSDGYVVNTAAFDAWNLQNIDTVGSDAGFLFDTSTGVAGGAGADIDTAVDVNQPVSFKMYGSGRFEAAAFRDFNQPLNPGQTFSIDMAVNYRNGFKGIDVRDPNERNIFTFVVCCDDYTVSNAAVGNGSIGSAYSNNTAFHLELTQTSAAGGVWAITRSGEISDFDNGSYVGKAASIKLFCSSTDVGPENAFYVNNLAISGAGADDAGAAAYPGTANGTWSYGDDGFISGPGAFGPWLLFTFEVGGSSGFRFDSSKGVAAGNGADIDTVADVNEPVSFKMFGQGVWEAAAFRDFGAPLSPGETFDVDMAVNYRNGFKGIDIRDPNGTNICTFVVCCDDYIITNAATGNGSVGNAYSNNTAFHLSISQTSAAGGTWTLRRSGAIEDLDSGTYTGVAASIKLFCSNTDAGSVENDFYFNNLRITKGRVSRRLRPE